MFARIQETEESIAWEQTKHLLNISKYPCKISTPNKKQISAANYINFIKQNTVRLKILNCTLTVHALI